jgi:murein DD-endopeptidase MepM/ murein hydrolase activator NlpD
MGPCFQEIAMSAVQNYRVQGGDTLTDIARRHGVSAETLMRANGMDASLADGHVSRSAHDPDRLQVGQQLVIPVATPGLEREHHVAAGETLAGIADRWGVSVKDLLAANPQFDAGKLGRHAGHGHGRDPDLLHVGDLIHRPQPAPDRSGGTAVRFGVRLSVDDARQQASVPVAGIATPGSTCSTSPIRPWAPTPPRPSSSAALRARAARTAASPRPTVVTPIPATPPTTAAPSPTSTRLPARRTRTGANCRPCASSCPPTRPRRAAPAWTRPTPAWPRPIWTSTTSRPVPPRASSTSSAACAASRWTSPT